MQRPASVTTFGILNIVFAVFGVFGLLATIALNRFLRVSGFEVPVGVRFSTAQ
jgi:hypothetical protein